MPFASSKTTSMFPAYEWDMEANDEYCIYAFGEKP